jgi:hypothetical protein
MDQKPLIAIIGSVRAEITGSPEKEAAGRVASREIGRALGAAGFRIAVYSSEDRFAEADVVAGFVETAPQESGLIEIFIPHWMTDQVRFDQEATRPELFIRRPSPEQSWQASYFKSLAAIDGMFMIGGGHSTYASGAIALNNELPLIALAGFNGAAELVWNSLTRADGYENTEDVQIMAGWSAETATKLADVLVLRCEDHSKVQKAKAETVRKSAAYDALIASAGKERWKSGVAIVSAILCLVALASALVLEPASRWYSAIFFANCLLVGACGATLRMILGNAPNIRIERVVVFGLLAGVMVGLAYIVPISGSDASIFSHEGLKLSAFKLQLVTTVLVVIPAGISFDILFEKYRNKAIEKAEAQAEVAMG